MRKHKLINPDSRSLSPGRRYPGLGGKVVDWVEHKFEQASYISTFGSRTTVTFAGGLLCE